MTKPENAVCYGRLHFFISGVPVASSMLLYYITYVFAI